VVNLAGSIDSGRQFPLPSSSVSSSVKENIDEDALSVSEDDLQEAPDHLFVLLMHSQSSDGTERRELALLADGAVELK
jgi:hypothetical protein